MAGRRVQQRGGVEQAAAARGLGRHQPGAVADLRIGAESADGLLVEAYAENLFDQDWVRDVGNGGKFFGVPTSVRANPRMVGLRVRIVR